MYFMSYSDSTPTESTPTESKQDTPVKNDLSTSPAPPAPKLVQQMELGVLIHL